MNSDWLWNHRIVRCGFDRKIVTDGAKFWTIRGFVLSLTDLGVYNGNILGVLRRINDDVEERER
jgi:hypothetical protein